MLDGKNALGTIQPLQLSQTALRSQWQDNYNDLANLNELNKLGDKDADAALRKVAQQFESMFVSMMLKSMRQANAVFEEDNEMNSFAMNMHRDMSDQQLALNLSQGRGIGLAESFYQQMKASYGGSLGIADANKSVLDGGNKLLSNNSELPSSLPTTIDQLRQRLQNTIPSLSENTIPAVIEASLKDGSRSANSSESLPQNFTSISGFITSLLPMAKTTAEELGVDPKVLLAQAALETGWGKYVIRDAEGTSTYNLFNIKADSRWNGNSAIVSTIEFNDGVAQRQQASFRRYDSYAESFKDYASFIKGNERYSTALAQAGDPVAYVEALQAAGYATDPNYADKIKNILFSEGIQASNSISEQRDFVTAGIQLAGNGGQGL